ncbi:cyclin-dependent kinase inhibitor 5-like isoform X1 [Iris pallida]|uniref:Cyclin-dependent kinase inhibitor n=1 Tax=Iris pallida TaxID=29817 RepID=A0AAX6G272_IRIPA|nr:cyclin-dependent kinase inhibitor 5-like isoform X1 [Iris pallida]KAJ6822428.1 cyclin-dependent kinase inhibitor 5-like isoform X1 [Iris pallida]
MGKYMKKAKISAEVALMEASHSSLVGVRTRARTLALRRLHQRPASAAAVASAESSAASSSCYLQLRSRRLEKLLPVEKPPKPQNPRNPSLALSRRSEGSKKEEVEEEEEIEASFGENVLDLEGRGSNSRDARETTPCNLIRDSETIGTPGSSNRPNNPTTTRRVQTSIQRNIPTSREMDEFFSGPEKVQQKAFAEKYNFDPVKDRPLPGRYEWVKLEN